MLNVKIIPADANDPETLNIQLEQQLADIITAARDVAVVAEELLREFTAHQLTTTPESMLQLSHVATVAPRLLTTTQQQMLSLMAMLRAV
jgi:hypothetical protein